MKRLFDALFGRGKKPKPPRAVEPAPAPAPPPPAPAPAPPAPPAAPVWDPTITWDETTYHGRPLDPLSKLLFAEEFEGPTHKLVGGHAPVGPGLFDPVGGEAYSLRNSQLEMRLYKAPDGVWHGGNLQTATNDGIGFTAIDCYWEARIKLPARWPGTWPAVWTLSPHDYGLNYHIEVDALEWYGGDPRGLHHTVHLWLAGRDYLKSNYVGTDRAADGDWHNHGVLIRSNGEVITYFDRMELARIKLPFRIPPQYALISLAVHAAEMDQLQPGAALFDYLRCYAAP